MRFSFSACLEDTHPHPDLVFSVISFTCSCMAFVALASIFNSFASSTEQERRLYASLASVSWFSPSPLSVALLGSLIRTLTVSTWRACCCSLGMYLRTGLEKKKPVCKVTFYLVCYRAIANDAFTPLLWLRLKVNTNQYPYNPCWGILSHWNWGDHLHWLTWIRVKLPSITLAVYNFSTTWQAFTKWNCLVWKE